MGKKKNRETPDEILVVSAIMGDLVAFDELVLRYRGAVVRIARSITGPDDAEDIAQDAFLIAFKALPSIEMPSKFAAWLNAITRNRARRFLREEKNHRQRRVGLDEVLLQQIAALSLPFGDERETEELILALDKIPQDYALALRMHFFDEMPHKRIAAFLGVPVSTVKWRVHRGKKYLREQFEHLRIKEELWKKKKN
ncbi:MAG: RNA polymerase sigma factor [Acidobacteriota bacterium]|nr:RNA polymerase sigma factor [Acidobacteriota bacterium]MDH3529653.1 RNA polymerase sigma factor [Acidobacteriota bacterium]